jgi:glyoxylase-like metal-dependent hydrolase (beta-lactamase superfamily II)
MFIGDFEIHLLSAGWWKADGGTMFGAVPKVLWERHLPADENNLIDASCIAVVVRQNGKVIVCETGIGTKLPEKRAQQAAVREPEQLLHSLQRLGIRPEEVDVVVATHLHWDHAGGLTRRAQDGSLQLTFPRAKHFFQQAEFDFAQHPDVRSKTGFIPDDFLPVAEAGLLETVSGEARVLPGLELRLTGGHTPGHQVVVFRAGELACVFTGDLVPYRPHLKVTWNLGYDLDVLRVLEEKARLLDEASRHRWLLVLSHDTEQPAGYLKPDGSFESEQELTLQPA